MGGIVMRGHDLSHDSEMLCRCCDFHSYKLPKVGAVSDSERELVEDLCKLCVDNFQLAAVKVRASDGSRFKSFDQNCSADSVGRVLPQIVAL